METPTTRPNNLNLFLKDKNLLSISNESSKLLIIHYNNNNNNFTPCNKNYNLNNDNNNYNNYNNNNNNIPFLDLTPIIKLEEREKNDLKFKRSIEIIESTENISIESQYSPNKKQRTLNFVVEYPQSQPQQFKKGGIQILNNGSFNNFNNNNNINNNNSNFYNNQYQGQNLTLNNNNNNNNNDNNSNLSNIKKNNKILNNNYFNNNNNDNLNNINNINKDIIIKQIQQEKQKEREVKKQQRKLEQQQKKLQQQQQQQTNSVNITNTASVVACTTSTASNSGSAASSPDINAPKKCTIPHCIVCEKGIPPCFEYEKPFWSHVLYITLYCLNKSSEILELNENNNNNAFEYKKLKGKRYFKLRKHILQFIESHWDIIVLKDLESNSNWKNIAGMTLSHYPLLFENGFSVLECTGYWCLADYSLNPYSVNFLTDL